MKFETFYRPTNKFENIIKIGNFLKNYQYWLQSKKNLNDNHKKIKKYIIKFIKEFFP